ncbi:MAG: NAD(P)/FAD-dependent oxidoreductase [bacterium]|jgi:protoporphyrinogen oxidase|nr:NAD(P)/FAD-dependent oxidoreductase [candidate division KSB1 bacterium]MDH7559518.1 NAD(P)/FAD-dependent oxidoreductase [bacterium]
MRQQVAIVGGGMLGMTLAYRLAGAGAEVTLFEAANELGGLVGSCRIGHVSWDRYYHVVLPSDSRLQALLGELGLSGQLVWKQTRTGLLIDGKLYSVSNVREFVSLPVLSLLDKLRLGANILYASRTRNWQRLERLPAVEWLRTWCGERTCAHFWVPLLRAKLGEEYRAASAAFIWATMARLYSARRTGAKREELGYVHGGYATVVEAMVRALHERGVKVKYGHRLHRVELEAAGDCLLRFDNGATHRTAKVVLTSPNPAIVQTCRWLPAPEAKRLGGATYMGIVCLALLLRKPLAGFYVTNIADGGFPFTGIIEMSSLVDPRTFGGHSLVYLPKYVRADDPLLLAPAEEILHSFVEALCRVYPALSLEDVVGWSVNREQHVFALPTLRYSESAPPMCTVAPGVFIVNSAQIVNTTLNVNEAVRQAEEAAQLLMDEA